MGAGGLQLIGPFSWSGVRLPSGNSLQPIHARSGQAASSELLSPG